MAEILADIAETYLDIYPQRGRNVDISVLAVAEPEPLQITYPYAAGGLESYYQLMQTQTNTLLGRFNTFVARSDRSAVEAYEQRLFVSPTWQILGGAVELIPLPEPDRSGRDRLVTVPYYSATDFGFNFFATDESIFGSVRRKSTRKAGNIDTPWQVAPERDSAQRNLTPSQLNLRNRRAEEIHAGIQRFDVVLTAIEQVG